MFDFVFDDLPPQSLGIERAQIRLFDNGPPWRDRIGLYVEVAAEEILVRHPADPEYESRVAPRYYTEWLDIPVGALRGRGLDMLDGYSMVYDEETEKEDGYDQPPGAVYQESHAGFTRATMTLTHIGGADYRVEAEGETEFGWRFRIDTQAALVRISFRSGEDGGDKAPSPEVEQWFDHLFDRAVFPAQWVRIGNDDFNWYVFEGAPSVD